MNRPNEAASPSSSLSSQSPRNDSNSASSAASPPSSHTSEPAITASTTAYCWPSTSVGHAALQLRFQQAPYSVSDTGNTARVASTARFRPPSLRINPYQLCETPVVLAVSATASRHGVSGRGSCSDGVEYWSETCTQCLVAHGQVGVWASRGQPLMAVNTRSGSR
jgi:hypothetical protein